ncbi:hypothetical protein MPTK1_2g17620 [Marchantia polymorpha subsp. ruderalis]|uniref:Uncharacterized protein n=1 Tax=Marchantia polymorpha TaxID=3197 RepID=A0A2R6WG85_MARPO|nr:hypothetical protein MARPO_0094s0030 [Marchantia polymorpha]BBN02728.1 hypothetical protein Mp_2g17620 [Marchantia polymorpha subsp. ruderalis]|eukprot:PTQ32853.1 hypothetical protein MARPO_0094s0030 [Marchantia polymorpha]
MAMSIWTQGTRSAVSLDFQASVHSREGCESSEKRKTGSRSRRIRTETSRSVGHSLTHAVTKYGSLLRVYERGAMLIRMLRARHSILYSPKGEK